MTNKELLEKINTKLKEIKPLRNLNSRDFRFKTWHASTINLLKMLPSDFTGDVNDFKKLTFTDTKYHRGARPFNPLDNTRYAEDLDSALKILKKITLIKKESKPGKISESGKESKIKKVTSPGKETISKSKDKKTPSNKKNLSAKKPGAVSKRKTTSKTRTKEAVKSGAKEKTSSPKKLAASKIKKSTDTGSK